MISAVHAASPTQPADPAKIRAAARQFEAVLLTQMLKTMREASASGWLGTGDDQAGMSMLEFAEEHLAQALASQGGIGLANLVVNGLEKP